LEAAGAQNAPSRGQVKRQLKNAVVRERLVRFSPLPSCFDECAAQYAAGVAGKSSARLARGFNAEEGLT